MNQDLYHRLHELLRSIHDGTEIMFGDSVVTSRHTRNDMIAGDCVEACLETLEDAPAEGELFPSRAEETLQTTVQVLAEVEALEPEDPEAKVVVLHTVAVVAGRLVKQLWEKQILPEFGLYATLAHAAHRACLALLEESPRSPPGYILDALAGSVRGVINRYRDEGHLESEWFGRLDRELAFQLLWFGRYLGHEEWFAYRGGAAMVLWDFSTAPELGEKALKLQEVGRGSRVDREVLTPYLGLLSELARGSRANRLAKRLEQLERTVMKAISQGEQSTAEKDQEEAALLRRHMDQLCEEVGASSIGEMRVDSNYLRGESDAVLDGLAAILDGEDLSTIHRLVTAWRFLRRPEARAQ
jgi:hypothetical protein